MNRRIKIGLVLVLLLVLGVAVVWRHASSYRRAVAAYKRDLISKGEKLTMAELAPPPTNDPVRAQQFLGLMSSIQSPTNFPSMMSIIKPGVAFVGCTNVSPTQMLGYNQNASNVSQLREILGTSKLGFNLNYSQGLNTILPHLKPLRLAEGLATGTVMQALTVGDVIQAESGLCVAVDLVRLFDANPWVDSDRLCLSMALTAISATWEALQSSQLSEPQLAELQAKWEEMDLFERVAAVLPMERNFCIESLAELRRTNFYGPLALPPSDSFLDDVGPRIKEWYDHYPRRWQWSASWSYDEEMYMIETYEIGLQAERRARGAGAFVPAMQEYEQKGDNLDRHHPESTNYFLFFDTPYGQAWGCLRQAARAETARRITVTAIALKRYQLAHNAYPASLNELVPQYLAQVPLDFMDGKPLRYKLQADGSFLLYSVGEDGEDNGGDPKPATGGYTWLDGRDFVWPRPATAQEIEDYRKAHRL